MIEADLIEHVRQRLGWSYPTNTWRLQVVVRAEIEVVERHAGGLLATETFQHDGEQPGTISVLRPISTITSVSERRTATDPPVLLAADDYDILSPWRLGRLDTGANPARWWGASVIVAYAPVVDQDLRDRVIVDLAVLSATYQHFDRRQLGDNISIVAPDYAVRRRELLEQITEGRALIF